MPPPTIAIEVVKGNGLGPHGNGTVASYPVGRGHTDTFYTSKPVGEGTVSIPECGDRNNALDSSFQCRHNVFHVEFQKYFIVKNLKVLMEKHVPDYPHYQQRLVLRGQVLEDFKELSEYGITAATASNLKLKLYLVEDAMRKVPKVEGPRRDSDGKRMYVSSVNPTGMTGNDFATTVGTFIP
eukprot:1040327-Rhodomonas_salina.1